MLRGGMVWPAWWECYPLPHLAPQALTQEKQQDIWSKYVENGGE